MTSSLHQPPLFGVAQTQETSDDYYTPAWLFERMGIAFDLDVCAPPGGISYIPAERYYTKADDGLSAPWCGRVWMNPPYSDSAPWVDRFIAHRHGIALVQHCRSRWHSTLWREADGLADPNQEGHPMFQFMRNGKPTNVYMPVVLAAFGDECVDAISRVGVVRRVA